MADANWHGQSAETAGSHLAVRARSSGICRWTQEGFGLGYVGYQLDLDRFASSFLQHRVGELL